MHLNPLAVEAKSLTISYGATQAIGPSDFSIPAGHVTAVIGPNGSGKSTLLNVIAGLIEPSAGSIQVGARDGVKGRIAYVLQNTKANEALPITVREVVSMGSYADAGWFRPLRASHQEAVASAMTRTGITDLAERQLHDLSGGQRQRVYVAQGLAQDHDLLLLDEPLTGIDLPTAQAIDVIIHDETERGCTVILTTHDLAEARAADFVLLLSGRLVRAGSPDEVLTDEALFEAYGTNLVHQGPQGPVFDDAAHHEH
ncbi:zinc ABC transporter ATP-binding protein AztA [soil metagenome]